MVHTTIVVLNYSIIRSPIFRSLDYPIVLKTKIKQIYYYDDIKHAQAEITKINFCAYLPLYID